MLLRFLFFLICVAAVGAGFYYLLTVALFNPICGMLSGASMRVAKSYLMSHGRCRDKKYTIRGVEFELHLRMFLFFAFYAALILFALFIVKRTWTLGFMPRWSLKLGMLGGIGTSCYFFHEKIAYTTICPCWLKFIYDNNMGHFEGIWYNDFSYNLNEFKDTEGHSPKQNWKYLSLQLASFAVFLPLERYE